VGQRSGVVAKIISQKDPDLHIIQGFVFPTIFYSNSNGKSI
jgi:hypothetical protein